MIQQLSDLIIYKQMRSHILVWTFFCCRLNPSLCTTITETDVNKSRQRQTIKGFSVQRKLCCLKKICSGRDSGTKQLTAYLQQAFSVPHFLSHKQISRKVFPAEM